jgi:hypothetical protein
MLRYSYQTGGNGWREVMAKRKMTKRERERSEFKKWLHNQITQKIENGTLKEPQITSYTRGAYKVFHKRAV